MSTKREITVFLTIYTADNSRILRVITVISADTIARTIRQHRLLAHAGHVTQNYHPGSLAKRSPAVRPDGRAKPQLVT